MRFSFFTHVKWILIPWLLFGMGVRHAGAARLDTAKVYPIPELLVTERYQPRNLISTVPVQILSTEDMNRLNSWQLADAVKYFSGVTVKDYGGIGGLKTVSVRSLGATHTSVSYDGIPLSDIQTGQIDIGRFALDHLSSVSLSNGQGDEIFQPARLFASASLLKLHTGKPKSSANKTLSGKMSLRMGSFGLFNPVFSLQKSFHSGFSAFLSGEWMSAHGEYPFVLAHTNDEGDVRTHEMRKNSDVKQVRLEATLFADSIENGTAYWKSYFYRSERGLPGATILYNADNFFSQRLWDYTFFTQAQFKRQWGKQVDMQLNGKFNRAYVHYLDSLYLNTAGRMESEFLQQEYYLSAALQYHPWIPFRLSFSTDGVLNTLDAVFESVQATNEFVAPTRMQWLSVLAARYLQERFSATGSLLFTKGFERTKQGNAGDDFQRFSPSLSFSYQPFSGQDIRLRAFYKHIFRLPTFNDLYYARVGNAGLLPEKTEQLNVGLTYNASAGDFLPRVFASVDAYRNDIHDKIVAMPTKNLFIWSMVNLGKVQVNGIDVTMEAVVAPDDNFSCVLGGNYTYNRALDVTDPDSDTYLHQLPYTPRVSGSAHVSFENPWVDVSYSMFISGHRYSGYQNYAENRLPAYADHNISFSRAFDFDANQWQAKLEVLNILNQQYAVVQWFPMPGRSFRAILAVRF